MKPPKLQISKGNCARVEYDEEYMYWEYWCREIEISPPRNNDRKNSYLNPISIETEENLVKNIESKFEQALKKPETNDSNGERGSSRYNGLEPPPPYREEFLTEKERKRSIKAR
ncbi:Uncharacterized protein Fot_17564 [Forsythia ovata]|uniref:Uncharacterized protein n=1 Tax=Forsythia ovata TaxID=205694 RepID=A0ABD1VFT4_9LAMI